MEHTPVRVSVCSQKGGVGKSSLTVLVASWLHYVMKRNVLVVDCDFPQWSIHTQRERELHVLNTATTSNSCSCASSAPRSENSGLS